MLNIRILAKADLQIFCSQGCSYIKCLSKRFLRYFVHKVVPMQNVCVRKRGVTQPKVYGICSKVNQFINTLGCNYMQNVRILAKAVLLIFCSQGYSYTKCCVRKRGVTTPKLYGTDSKFNQFIYTLVCNYMPNIRTLAKAVLKIFCSQGCSLRLPVSPYIFL